MIRDAIFEEAENFYKEGWRAEDMEKMIEQYEEMSYTEIDEVCEILAVLERNEKARGTKQ